MSRLQLIYLQHLELLCLRRFEAITDERIAGVYHAVVGFDEERGGALAPGEMVDMIGFITREIIMKPSVSPPRAHATIELCTLKKW